MATKTPRERFDDLNRLHWQKIEARVERDPEYREWKETHAPHLKERLEHRHGIYLKDEPPYGWSLPGMVRRHLCPTDAKEQWDLDESIFSGETLLLEIDLRRLNLKDRNLLAEAVWQFAGKELVSPSCERLTDFEARMDAWKHGETEPTKHPDTWHNYRPRNLDEVLAIVKERQTPRRPEEILARLRGRFPALTLEEVERAVKKPTGSAMDLAVWEERRGQPTPDEIAARLGVTPGKVAEVLKDRGPAGRLLDGIPDAVAPPPAETPPPEEPLTPEEIAHRVEGHLARALMAEPVWNKEAGDVVAATMEQCAKRLLKAAGAFRRIVAEP